MLITGQKGAIIYNIIYRQVGAKGLAGESMDILVGDVITMKKQHPCGSKEFEVLRIGADFKVKCLGCGREVMVPRAKLERNIRGVKRP